MAIFTHEMKGGILIPEKRYIKAVWTMTKLEYTLSLLSTMLVKGQAPVDTEIDCCIFVVC